MHPFEMTRALVDLESITDNEKDVGEYLLRYLSGLAAGSAGKATGLEKRDILHRRPPPRPPPRPVQPGLCGRLDLGGGLFDSFSGGFKGKLSADLETSDVIGAED